MQLTYDPSAGLLCSAGRHIANSPAPTQASRRFYYAPSTRTTFDARFLVTPTTRIPDDTSRRFFYAHHRRAPRPLLLRPAGAFTTRRRRAPPSTLAFSSRPLRASPTTPAGAFSTRTIAAHHARSYSGQPALTTLFLRAPSTRTEIATRTIDAHHARSYSGQPALTTLFLRAPSTRTEIATRTIDAHHARSYSGQPALLLRCFYAHHRRAPKSRIAPCWAFRPPTRHTEPYGPC